VKADLLNREFAPRAVPHAGGPLRLTPDDALALVDRASEEGVPILTVDALTVAPDREVRRTPHRADFSATVAEGELEDDVAVAPRADEVVGVRPAAVPLGDDPLEAV
jgi:hypothetical protein